MRPGIHVALVTLAAFPVGTCGWIVGSRMSLVRNAVGRRSSPLVTCALDKSLLHQGDELYALLQDVERSDEDRCMYYLKLGALIDELAPVPGTGPEWPNEKFDAPAAVGFPSGNVAERLTAEECYRLATDIAPQVGQAHKFLADHLVALGGADVAAESFARAAEMMPDDVRCAVHDFYGSPTGRQAGALPFAAAPSPAVLGPDGLRELECDFAIDGWEELAATSFEAHGASVLPQFLTREEFSQLMEVVLETIADDNAADFSPETREPSKRLHKGLPIDKSRRALDSLTARLWPLLSIILQAEAAPLIGAGFMCVAPGATAQELHKDVHGWDRHGPATGQRRGEPICVGEGGAARAISVQIQLTDTRQDERGGTWGSLDVMPGSHRPDAARADPDSIQGAIEDGTELVPINVPPGTVTIYSSRLWHRGGSYSRDERGRIFCFLTFNEPESPAPPGLIHTMARKDVGKWNAGVSGLIEMAS